ncbi:MAG: hypothetical protein RBR35_10000 [Salinivirgaceae bacterium]|nr:hypothetical protein [Salinivirgaceae bacterium]
MSHESVAPGRAGVEPAGVWDFEGIHNPILPVADTLPLMFSML